ncbi:hypothetical protein [Chryseobacterium aurantiacum]|uniref:hypothetical protein n=1 Tax=Chryseobacterium aurantiacum TaxID=2116499 RepID=UPI001E2A8426|nr:hypothetical protein [Chryseobacterium aurantiacum]
MKGLHLESIEVREIKLKDEEIILKTKSFLSFVYVVKGKESFSLFHSRNLIILKVKMQH